MLEYNSNKIVIKESLDANDIKEIKEMINNQLKKLFYTLYIKRLLWEK